MQTKILMGRGKEKKVAQIYHAIVN